LPHIWYLGSGNQISKYELTDLLPNEIESLKTNFEFPDNRTLFEKTIDFAKSYWWVLILGLVILVSSYVLMRRTLIKRSLTNKPEQIYGYLEEFDGSSTRHSINKTTLCIGRNRDNDICLINDSISSHHAEIHRKRDGGFNIVVLGSTNGVLVNGTKINQSVITTGDVIELGEVRLNFFIN
jgi:hypothetical protein